MERKDLTGQRFGRLVVLEYAGLNSGIRKLTTWKCLCDCGTVKTLIGLDLGRGTNSCGCLHKELASLHNQTHGLSKTREYATWLRMRHRCYNSNNADYKSYGGRGIKVCDRWLEPKGKGFLNFFEDMGLRPDGFSIERKDFNGDYCPENCIWIPMAEQSKNRRGNVTLTFKGETHHMAEWARIIGITESAIQARIRRKWSLEAILTTPLYIDYGKEEQVRTHCRSGKHVWIEENIYVSRGVSCCQRCKEDAAKRRKQAALNDTSSQL